MSLPTPGHRIPMPAPRSNTALFALINAADRVLDNGVAFGPLGPHKDTECESCGAMRGGGTRCDYCGK